MIAKCTLTCSQIDKLNSSTLVKKDTRASHQKRSGHGIFTWANGASYDGEFFENRRHGRGKQKWPDGSSYIGEFRCDLREGHGRHTWANGEVYEGTFANDKRHGKGRYFWPNGTHFEGNFSHDHKEGYGCFHFSDLKQFKGMYKNDERNGPGVVFYSNGAQDIGLWHGEKLIKLCSVMNNAFLFQHFSEYVVNAGNNVPLNVRQVNSAISESPLFMDIEENEITQDSFLLHEKGSEMSLLSDIINGGRNFSNYKKGPCELASEELLLASGDGDWMRVIELLEEGLVHVDVADKTGFTALLAASVNCHKDVINSLLDYGADINKLNYEGLSPLAACHVLFYTKHTWKKNIGETLSEENLLNSVRWDTDNGTFIQRNPVYKQDERVSDSKNSISRNKVENKPLEMKRDIHKNFKMDVHTRDKLELYESRESDQLFASTKKLYPIADEMKCFCPRHTKSRLNNTLNSAQFCDESDVRMFSTDRRFVDKSPSMKKWTNHSPDSIDKQLFIYDFLSGRTSPSLKHCHENNPSHVENCSSLEISDLNITSSCEDGEQSLQYSLQNVISSSLSSPFTDDETDSLNSCKQSKKRLLAQQRRPHLEAAVQLLLKRGASPNASSLPMPVLFFAIKAADAPVVALLLEKGADPNARLSSEQLGITPLHIAVALPSNSFTISKLLLTSGADPNMRDFAFTGVENGRTPLHTACCREDDDEKANHVIKLLLEYEADPNMLCNGHSALSLAIGSGNDLAVETLLEHEADASLPLKCGVGSSLCAAISFTAEKRRKFVDRIRLVNKLIRNGANILAPITINDKWPPGTVVDYAYNVFYQDQRISKTPYHSLSSYERKVLNSRRKMLDHLADLLRAHVLKREKKLLEEQLSCARSLKMESYKDINKKHIDRPLSFRFDETVMEDGKSKAKPSNILASTFDESSETMSRVSFSDGRFSDCGLRVAVVNMSVDVMNISQLSLNSSNNQQIISICRFRYCYECGRSLAVRLSSCTRCKQVFYCSRNCKMKAWKSRHKAECKVSSARTKSSSSKRAEIPKSAECKANHDASSKCASRMKRKNLRSASKNVKVVTTETTVNVRRCK